MFEKKKWNALKLYLTGIHDRKHKYLYVNLNDPRVWYFTSIHPDEIFYHRPNIDTAIHKVTFLTDEVPDMLSEALKVYGNEHDGCITIWLDGLSKIFNSATYDKVIYSESFTFVMKRGSGDNATELEFFRTHYYMAKAGKNLKATPINTHLPSKDMIRLEGLYESTMRDFENPIVMTNHIPEEFNPREVSILRYDLTDLPWCPEEDIDFRVPLTAGQSSVSNQSYISKSKKDCTITAYVGLKSRTCKHYLKFKNEIMEVDSIRPGAIWFPCNIKNKDTDK